MKIGVLFFLVMFLSSFVSASLGISPAVVEFDYAPGEEYKINYLVISSNPDKEVEIYAAGDLAEYVTLSKKTVTGQDTFTATLKLPDEISKPGEHRIGIGVRDIVTEENFIGTAIDISGAIKVFVPYPGRYADVFLNVPNGNVDSLIPVEARVINRGRESLNVEVKVDFFDGNEEFVYSMPFLPASLNSSDSRYFRKFLNTSLYKPGNYLAEAVVDYGEETRVNESFKIGSLFVNITNFTKSLETGGIQKFLVNIESLWNDNLKGVFADIFVFNQTGNISVRTPGVDLVGWNQETLVGFLDTTGLEGRYRTEITLHYAGEESKRSGELLVFKSGLSFVAISIGILAMSIVLVVIIIIWMKKRKIRVRRRK